ncbi:MAG: ATPase, T2SS/T4P/T4SS family [Candidatus Omnitrophota bacterium]
MDKTNGKDAADQNKPGKRMLGELLCEQSVITKEALTEALREQKVTHQRLGEILVERGLVTAEQINRALASQMDTQAVHVSDYIIAPEIIALIREEDARRFHVMPLFKSEDVLYVAMKNPNDVLAIDQLHRQSGLKIKSFLVAEDEVLWAIEQYYQISGSVEEMILGIDSEKLSKGEKEQETAVIKLVSLMISKAVHELASDIHIEPEQNVLNVRYRIDGVLHKRHVLPKALQSAIISRVKIMSNLDISEKRLPQDGRIRLRVEAKEIEFRVSTCPTIYGENIVLRILDKSGLVLGLESLGFSQRSFEYFKSMITTPYGIILVTGPTGSGKTTTLYSALQILNKENVNIMTVEDPVEYEFQRMRQVQVSPDIGLTFASALRSFLRQDPNIIMIGEIRDLETAQIAVQAALTGHLVFSTLHTNDSPTAFTRLINMGVEPFLVSSSLIGIVAQRLMRKICPKCKEEYEPSKELLDSLGIENKNISQIKFARGKGCAACNKTGYKGRVGIYEVLKNTPGLQALVLEKVSADEIRKAAVKEGMQTLRDIAIEKLLAGITTIEEVVRVTQENIEDEVGIE